MLLFLLWSDSLFPQTLSLWRHSYISKEMFFSADRVASVYNVSVGNVWLYSVPALFLLLLYSTLPPLSVSLLYQFVVALLSVVSSCQSQGSMVKTETAVIKIQDKQEQYRAENSG